MGKGALTNGRGEGLGSGWVDGWMDERTGSGRGVVAEWERP